MGIKHRADSGFRKFSALSQVRFRRTVKCFVMPYVSYPKPLCAMRKKATHIQAHLVFAVTQANAEKPKELEFLPTLDRNKMRN